MDIGIKVAEQLMQESKQIIGLYPGAFKPATRAHFTIVERASKICDEVHVIIANNVREGYTPELSEKIWKQYKKLLPENVIIKVSPTPSPITEIYSIIKDITNDYLVIYGKGEEDRYNSINESKYPHVEIVDAGQYDGISATLLREAISKRNLEEIKNLIPEGIKVYDFLMNFQLHEIKVNKPNTFPTSLRPYKNTLDHYIKYTQKDDNILMNIFNYIISQFNENKWDPGEFKNWASDTEVLKKLVRFVKNYVETKHLDENIEEGKNIGDLYHFTDIEGLAGILDSNELKTSSTPSEDHQRDFQYLSKEKRAQIQKSGDKRINYISFSRNKSFYKQRTKIGRIPITRISFDGNKLSDKYKFIPFNYYSGESATETDRFNDNEGEERIPTNSPISNLNNYIKNINILLDKIEDNETYLKQAESLISKYPQIISLYKEKPMSIEQYIKDILQTIEPYRDEEYMEEGRNAIQNIFSEIKVNKPGLNFPININNQEQALKIGKLLYDKDYYWLNDQKPDYTNAPFKSNNFEPFKIFLADDPKYKIIDYEYTTNFEEIEEIKVNRPNQRSSKEVIQLRKDVIERSKDIEGSYLQTLNIIDDLIETYGDIEHYQTINNVIKSLSDDNLNKLYKELLNIDIISEIKIDKPLNKEQNDINSWIEHIQDVKEISREESIKFLKIHGSQKNRDLLKKYNINESIQTNPKRYLQLLNTLVKECCKDLDIKKPIIKLINNDKYTLKNKSYAGYFPGTNEIKLVIYGRTLADSCRSLSHELFHSKQNIEGRLTSNAGGDGDAFENEANSYSGKTMRKFGRKYPEIYFMRYKDGLNEIKI